MLTNQKKGRSRDYLRVVLVVPHIFVILDCLHPALHHALAIGCLFACCLQIFIRPAIWIRVERKCDEGVYWFCGANQAEGVVAAHLEYEGGRRGLDDFRAGDFSRCESERDTWAEKGSGDC